MKRLLTAALALSMIGGGAAVAQPDRHDQGSRYNDQAGYQNRDHRNDQAGYQNRDHGDHRNDNGGYNQSRDNGYNRDHADNYGDNGHHWGRGQRLPREYYRDRSHYVDYRTYHLRRPPSGYRWVRTDDNNYAMVAIASGLIASLVAASR